MAEASAQPEKVGTGMGPAAQFVEIQPGALPLYRPQAQGVVVDGNDCITLGG
ncbi:hypothetical protein D3C80_2202260 [compost metagenome]